jgi:hypothetical protein
VSFDLDAARAAQSEFAGEDFEFILGGDKFAIPPQKQWPVQAAESLAAGNLSTFLSLVMGQEAFDGFMGHDPLIGDVELIVEAFARAQGITSLPNSGRPPRPASTRM